MACSTRDVNLARNKSKLKKTLDKIRPDQVSVNLGILSAEYSTKKPSAKSKATRHMQELAKAGFAGILLNAVAALRVDREGNYSRVSPTRVGSPLSGGIPTSEVVWIPNYSWDVIAKALEDFDYDDYGWRSYNKRIAKEYKALEYAPYAESHLQHGYPEVHALVLKVRDLDKNLPEQWKKATPSGGFFDEPRPTNSDAEFQAFEAARESVVRELSDLLHELRLKVLAGRPLGGSCDLCS